MNIKLINDILVNRRRTKKGVTLPGSRQSEGIGQVEKALRSSHGSKTDHVFTPNVGTTFDSVAEAYEFYNLYSWEKGFGISYGKSDKNRGNDYSTMQELQCSCQVMMWTDASRGLVNFNYLIVGICKNMCLPLHMFQSWIVSDL